MTTETDEIAAKATENLKAFRDLITAKIEGEKEDLDLYLIASRLPRGILIQTSEKVIDKAVDGLDDHTVMSDLNQLSALLPLGPGLNIAVPLGEIPYLIANLNAIFHKALFDASKVIKTEK